MSLSIGKDLVIYEVNASYDRLIHWLSCGWIGLHTVCVYEYVWRGLCEYYSGTFVCVCVYACSLSLTLTPTDVE